MPLDVSLTNEQKVLVTLAPTTSTGGPATLDGDITVEVTSGDATFSIWDSLSFYAISGTNPGPSVFVVKGDADLGSGIVELVDSVNLNVTGAMAANLGMTAGTPEAK